jgi:hypothetical protein
VDNVSGSTHDRRRPFKFGDGEFVYSFKNATISVIIGKTKCRIDTEVVKSRHSTTTEQDYSFGFYEKYFIPCQKKY